RLRAAEALAGPDLQRSVVLPVEDHEVQHLAPEPGERLGIAAAQHQFTDTTRHSSIHSQPDTTIHASPQEARGPGPDHGSAEASGPLRHPRHLFRCAGTSLPAGAGRRPPPARPCAGPTRPAAASGDRGPLEFHHQLGKCQAGHPEHRGGRCHPCGAQPGRQHPVVLEEPVDIGGVHGEAHQVRQCHARLLQHGLQVVDGQRQLRSHVAGVTGLAVLTHRALPRAVQRPVLAPHQLPLAVAQLHRPRPRIHRRAFHPRINSFAVTADARARGSRVRRPCVTRASLSGYHDTLGHVCRYRFRRRADRLISLVLLLRRRGRMTASALARELEVSTRTVLRDIEALSTAGVPVYAERGRHGGFELLHDFRTELTGLTGLNHDEALALLAAGTARGDHVFGLGPALASALRKVLDALPETHRTTAADAARRLLPDPPADLLARRRDTDRIPDAAMNEVRRAVLAGRKLRIHYAAVGQQAQWRTVDPIGLVTVGDRGYLLATRSGADRT